MRTRITAAGRRLDGLRQDGPRPDGTGAAAPGPDPRFRAMLRERLLTAAARPPENGCSENGRKGARNAGSTERID